MRPFIVQYIGKSEGLSLLERHYLALLVAAHGTSIRIPRFAGSGPQRIGSALLTTRGPIFAFGSGQGFVPRTLRLLSRHLSPGSVKRGL